MKSAIAVPAQSRSRRGLGQGLLTLLVMITFGFVFYSLVERPFFAAQRAPAEAAGVPAL